MRKVISFTKLRKFRPSRKALLIMGYFSVIALLLVAVTYNGFGSLIQAPADADTADPIVEENVGAAYGNPPMGTAEEESEYEGDLAEEDAIPTLAMPDEPMQWPLEAEILVSHHEAYKIGNQWRAHAGVNLKASIDDEVRAAWPGIVEYVGNDSRLGWYLEIRHGGDYITKYANLKEEPFVSLGDHVRTGDLIGIVGDSAQMGVSEGAFLNFIVYQDQQAVDPVSVLSPH